MKDTIKNYIINQIEQRIYDNDVVNNLARMTGYCRRTIENIFFNEYKMSIGGYLHRRRMTRAALMLRMTRLSVIEISEKLNYYSSQNFSRAFKSYFGKTPTGYRNSELWDNQQLQIPLVTAYPELDLHIIELEKDIYICGEESDYKTHYIKSDSNGFVKNINESVQCFLGKGESTVWTCTIIENSVSLSTSREDMVGVKLITGIETTSIQKNIVPRGWYATFKFDGEIVNYDAFSIAVYIKLLAEKKIKFSEKICYQKITCFDPKKKIMTCILYVPIQNICETNSHKNVK
ncbi:helix-turn-helix transcriptional regulator [Salmonella enterica]|nr:helix-turn-helix domain-containing protein [Salmonella enterica]ECL6067768.1 helix-turn-helix domain-containing protein [Salmonella enterica]ECP1354581.1 helix-turn-helix transcriptional regulator [Salmonella enterica]EEB3186283.1 helix-turn-helix transcriptional regulator [Salmonella enterica]EFR0683393.1 helix-turn-helix transcriptional regulator [Salmonella enterica]